MKTKIQRWGNGLGLRIPVALAEEVSVRAGSTVDLSLADGRLVIRPDPVCYQLDDLLAEINDDNIHREVAFGARMGREVW